MILGRYITAEVLRPMLVICAILLIIFVGYSSGRYLTDAVNGLLSVDTVAKLIGLRAIIALEVLLPVALYLSVVLGLGRMHADQEITALTASGVGTGRILWVVLRLALLLAVPVAVLSLYARPWAYDQSYWIKARADADIDVETIEPGRFFESEHRNRAIFVDDIGGAERRLEGVFLRSASGDNTRVISAGRGVQRTDPATGRRSLVLEDVHVFELSPDGRSDKAGHFGRMVLQLKAPDPITVGFKRKAATTAELMGSTEPAEQAELQWRFSTAPSTILLAVLAVLLSGYAQSIGRYAKAMLAVLVYALYYNLGGIAKNWVESGALPAVPGIWWVQALLLVLIAVLYTQPGRRMRAQPQAEPA